MLCLYGDTSTRYVLQHIPTARIVCISSNNPIIYAMKHGLVKAILIPIQNGSSTWHTLSFDSAESARNFLEDPAHAKYMYIDPIISQNTVYRESFVSWRSLFEVGLLQYDSKYPLHQYEPINCASLPDLIPSYINIPINTLQHTKAII